MRYETIRRVLPRPLLRSILHFETAIENSLEEFAATLRQGDRVLDAGAGEGGHARYFTQQHYIPVDLAVGDLTWNYGNLAAVADITALPFRDRSFAACINIVTLEHVREPAAALREMYRALMPHGRLLLAVPHEWEVHQSPHDYFRYTRHGLSYLLDKAGFDDYRVEPVGGYFRLLSRRLWNGLQFFRGPLLPLAALLLGPPAFVLPLFDGLDRRKDFTLGYICVARKQG